MAVETLSSTRITPGMDRLYELREQGNLTALVAELPGDLATPVSVYLKLRTGRPAFLLESVEHGEHTGRYSFMGVEPTKIATIRADKALVLADGQATLQAIDDEGPLAIPQSWLEGVQPVFDAQVPPFAGGTVGYLGYDMIRYFEPRLSRTAHPPTGFDLPEGVFMLFDSLVAFDHVKHKLLVIAIIRLDGDLEANYAQGVERIRRIVSRLAGPVPESLPQATTPGGELVSNMSLESYAQAVLAAKEHIAAGDIFQVVLSQRLQCGTAAHPFAIYRALRMINPSPYMFYLELPDDMQMIGSSPEVLVRLQDGHATVRPLAGTRPRGATPEADRALAQELLADPKERAEHVMLVDLGRNDLGRVCQYGTVQVPRIMDVEKYSHVMHIVSDVVGELDERYNAFDLLKAVFPAGTVSGAPKIRAMEIIDELEPCRRGPYAGSVGYIGYDGNMDTCITIRTIVMKNQVAYVQAGAGLVADSDPQREYEETLHKARALAEAIRLAERGFAEG